MATDIRDTGIGTLACSTTPGVLTINPQRDYWFHHPGVKADAADDAGVIVLSLVTQTMDASAAPSKFVLTSKATVCIRRGLGKSIQFASISGTPDLCYSEGETDFGARH